MIRGYTLHGAAQLEFENDLGSIEVGKVADLVILDHNLFETPPNQIKSARPTVILMEGKLVSGAIP